jgi:glycosyltransferase involved in cell wall biosynthesis
VSQAFAAWELQRGSAIPAYYESAALLPAREAPSLGAGWPGQDHKLLLIAACSSPVRAVAAWHSFRSGLTNPESLSTESTRLLAQVALRLHQLGVKDSLLDRALSTTRHTWCSNQLRVRAAVDAIATLERADLPTIALKGLALLAGPYSDLRQRPMFDIDLLVGGQDLTRALGVLNEAGWQPVSEGLPQRDRAGAVPLGYSFQLARGRVELDLHWHALRQDASTALDARVWQHAVRRPLGDASIVCPHSTELLLMACVHGMGWNGGPAALWAADLWRILNFGEATIDWQRLTATAAERHLTLVLYDGLRFVATELGAAVPEAVLAQLASAPVCELEALEYAALTRGFRDTVIGERWAMRHLAERRREDRLERGTGRQFALAVQSSARAAPALVEPATPSVPAAVDRAGALTAEPLVSCLCVTEDRPEFIPWLLWCYDRQSWPQRELVIVDSSVPPLMLPERPDVRIVYVEPGTALGEKRNVALDAATGSAIAWFDDDDWQHPDRLTWLVEALQQARVPAEATHAGPTGAWFVDLFEDRCTEYRGAGFALFNGSLFVRANVEKHRFQPQQRAAEDTLWLRALAQARGSLAVSQLPPVFFWLCHDSNTSNPRTARRLERKLDELRTLVGAAWADTDQQLGALRERLSSRPTPEANARNGASAIRARGVVSFADAPRVWVITPCMNRLEFLRRTAPLVLKNQHLNYCVVDYSCSEQCGDWLEQTFPEAIAAGRCVALRVPGQSLFNKCSAHNAGARRALAEGAEYLCFLDADTLVTPDFFGWLLPELQRKRFLIAALGPDGCDVPSLTGLLVVSAAEFAATEGFDESFTGWGSEDIEMRLRLHVQHELEYGDIPLSLVAPIWHEDALRSSNYEQKNIHVSDRQNFSRLVQKLSAWRMECRFDQRTAARLFYRPPRSAIASRRLGSPPVFLNRG